MQVIWFVVIVLATFTAGYVGYSTYLARELTELDDERETPAHRYADGQEYVPSKKPVLLGHHFSSVAGGAPIAGPLTAVAAFGWAPALLWVAIGNPLFGAVHDFMALVSSVRHEGKSIGYIVGEYVGERGKNMLLWFAFLLILLVVAAFVFLIAQVFNAYPGAATASLLYIALALGFGVYLYQLNGPFLPGAALFVAGIFAGVWAGYEYPIALVETGALPDGTIVLFGDLAAAELLPLAEAQNPNFAAWALVTVLYSFLAATLPVWVLLQPRDFLTSSLLYTGIGAMLVGVVVGTIRPFEPVDIPVSGVEGLNSVTIDSLEASVPAFEGFVHPSLGPLVPFLFLTIACGTISGFHSLVSSGTTAKQLNRESDARTIGYGAMLGEGLLALTAIIAVSIAAATVASGTLASAIAVFPAGGGALVSTLGIPAGLASIFIALVFASFLLTSTDTATRLGRYMVEELVGTPETSLQETLTNRYANAGVTVVAGYLLVASGSWGNLWLLFGGANQLLAALALLVATIWLANWSDTKQLVSTGVPLAFMVTVTVLGLLWVALLRFPATIIEPAVVSDPAVTEWDVWGDVVSDPGTLAQVEASMHTLSFALLTVLALVLVSLAIRLLRLGIDNISDARAGLATAAVTDGGEHVPEPDGTAEADDVGADDE
ncbi:carbon starvation CstA family protein [Halovivax limisalsi]|uniref:carbon starvation CstA family protein n=1 Tax=Halovivax limisalsi TaxID=1453760 RepID=UPI001FFCE0A6|nr:carbon starvation protein A [Halovivax limisalsi]